MQTASSRFRCRGFGLAGLLLAAGAAHAYSWGDLATGYGTQGRQAVDYPPAGTGNRNSANVSRIDGAGRLLIAGISTSPLLQDRAVVMRLTATGQLDGGFGNNGFASFTPPLPNADGSITAMAVTPDNRVYVAYVYRPAGQNTGGKSRLCRLTAEGDPDLAYGTQGCVDVFFGNNNPDEFVADIALLADGRQLLLGNLPGQVAYALTRYLDDGDIDPCFGKPYCGLATSTIYFFTADALRAVSLALGPDERILVGMEFDADGGGANVNFLVERLYPTGDVDKTFSGDSLAIVAFDLVANGADRPKKLLVRPNGRSVVVGESQTGLGTMVTVAQLDASGAPDPDFGVGGKLQSFLSDVALNQNPTTATLKSDGRVLIGGNPEFGDGSRSAVVLQLLANGSDDAAFGFQGRVYAGLLADDGNPVSVPIDHVSGVHPFGDTIAIVGSTTTAEPALQSWFAAVWLEHGIFRDDFEGN